jgi:ubiquinone/menaquinone biosynthesis C-methylase UbiE
MIDEQKSCACNSHVCPHKIAFMLDNPIRKLFQNPSKVVGEYIHPGDTVIDLGCGPGFFSIPMAVMVGENGKVIAVDLQAEMLEHVKRKASTKNLAPRMKFHLCKNDSIGLELEKKADFILAYYMVHETPNPAAFLHEVKTFLNKGGKFLIVEPKMHVNRQKYEEMITMAEKAGFIVLGNPPGKGGRSVLLTVEE